MSILTVQAQRPVGALSENQISVISDLVGQTLTLFGNVEPPIGAAGEPVEGAFQVVALVSGAPQDRVARQQTGRFHIRLNTDAETFPVPALTTGWLGGVVVKCQEIAR